MKIDSQSICFSVASIEIKLFLLGYSSFACGLPMIAQQVIWRLAQLTNYITQLYPIFATRYNT